MRQNSKGKRINHLFLQFEETTYIWSHFLTTFHVWCSSWGCAISFKKNGKSCGDLPHMQSYTPMESLDGEEQKKLQFFVNECSFQKWQVDRRNIKDVVLGHHDIGASMISQSMSFNQIIGFSMVSMPRSFKLIYQLERDCPHELTQA